MSEKNDECMVNSPAHYQGRSMQVIDVIENFDLGFNLGNALKYILRSGKKDSKTEDLRKAKWYLDRECNLENTNQEKEVTTNTQLDKKNNDFREILLRVPNSLIQAISKDLEGKPWMNRTQWIMDAIAAKIEGKNEREDR